MATPAPRASAVDRKFLNGPSLGKPFLFRAVCFPGHSGKRPSVLIFCCAGWPLDSFRRAETTETRTPFAISSLTAKHTLDGSILMARRAFFRLDSVRLRAG